MVIESAPRTAIPEAALARFLQELPNYVVLRNDEDLFGNLQRGGDIDLLVGNMEVAERSLIRHLGVPIRVLKSSYARGYSWDWGHVDLVQAIDWRGASYLRTQAILDGQRLSVRGRPVPRIAHEAVISWLTSLLWGGFYKERYGTKIREAVETDGAALRRSLREVAGKNMGDRLWQAAADGHPETSGTWVTSLRRLIWWRACLRSPLHTIERYLAFVIAELELRIRPPAPWIAILGSDGSGKSSVLNGLVDRFAACPYAAIKAFHWRPRVIAQGRGGEPVTDPHGKSSHGLIGSVLSLLVLASDWLVGYWTWLVHLRSKGCILAFDRMYFDLVVDPKRYRYGAGPRLARALWWLLPKPDLVFLLDSPPEVLWQRKQEVALAELARQRKAYTALVRGLPGGHVLDGTLRPGALVSQVERVVREWMLKRSSEILRGDHTPLLTSSTASVECSSPAPESVGRRDGAR